MGDVKWDLQQYLEHMEVQATNRHNELVGKVDSVVEKVNDHEGRLVLVEGTRKSIRWLAVTMVGALLVGAVDFIFNNLPRVLASINQP